MKSKPITDRVTNAKNIFTIPVQCNPKPEKTQLISLRLAMLLYLPKMHVSKMPVVTKTLLKVSNIGLYLGWEISLTYTMATVLNPVKFL